MCILYRSGDVTLGLSYTLDASLMVVAVNYVDGHRNFGYIRPIKGRWRYACNGMTRAHAAACRGAGAASSEPQPRISGCGRMERQAEGYMWSQVLHQGQAVVYLRRKAMAPA